MMSSNIFLALVTSMYSRTSACIRGDILFGIRGGAAFAADYHRVVRPHLAALDVLRKRTLLQIVAACGGLLPLLLLAVGLGWLFNFMVGWCAFLGGGFGLYYLATRQARLYRGAIRAAIMPPVCAFIGDLAFSADPENAIDLRPFAALRLLPFHDTIRQEYVLCGDYRDRRFRFTEARLYDDQKVFYLAFVAIEL